MKKVRTSPNSDSSIFFHPWKKKSIHLDGSNPRRSPRPGLLCPAPGWAAPLQTPTTSSTGWPRGSQAQAPPVFSAENIGRSTGESLHVFLGAPHGQIFQITDTVTLGTFSTVRQKRGWFNPYSDTVSYKSTSLNTEWVWLYELVRAIFSVHILSRILFVICPARNCSYVVGLQAWLQHSTFFDTSSFFFFS